jgi:hypothetical protein
MMKSEEIKVFISNRESKCDECGKELGRKAWITLDRDKGWLCLTCADLDHLTFLPAGDAAVTRRARKHSALSAVVLKWSRARKGMSDRDPWLKTRPWCKPKMNAWLTMIAGWKRIESSLRLTQITQITQRRQGRKPGSRDSQKHSMSLRSRREHRAQSEANIDGRNPG